MPRAKPLSQHRLHGQATALKRELATVPEGRGELWAPPADFDDLERAYWGHAIQYAPLGLLTETDRGVLEAWCQAAAGHHRARDLLKAEGLKIRVGPRRWGAHPAAAI